MGALRGTSSTSVKDRWPPQTLTFAVLWAVVLVAVVVAVIHTLTRHEEVATTWLSVPNLLVSVVTLRLTWQRPARLEIFRADELGLIDLIFFVRQPCEATDGLSRPEDYLLQLHVTVVKMGERKAVLSHTEIDRLIDATGQSVRLPGGPERINGMQWVRRSGYRDLQPFSESSTVHPPYVLERDDVIVLQFRQRRGPSWGPGADLVQLRQFWEAISQPIVAAEGRYLWRRGQRLIESRFSVPLSVTQQADFANLLHDLTDGFASQPFTNVWRPRIE